MKKEVIIDEFDFLTGDGYIHGMIYDKCKQILPENTPEIMEGNHSIYHYTHVEGLKNILKNENLWFTHIHYLNDREEVNVGANHYIQCNKEILEAEREINPNIPSFSVDTSNLHTYVCCFSLEKDALPMWNYYTKDASNKGYNIGFDYRKLMASLITKNPELEGCGFSCGQVNYSLENAIGKVKGIKEMEQGHNYIDTAIEYVKMKLSELDMRILQFSTEERKAYQRKLREILNRIKVIKLRGEDAIFDTCYTMEVIFYMKKRFFQHENEFRIVITIPDNKFKEIERKDIYGYRNANGILTPYLKLNFDKNALLGITASPTNNGELVDKSIDEYCEYCGIDKNSLTEGITHSEIPVRF